jgi:hypothetical protein
MENTQPAGPLLDALRSAGARYALGADLRDVPLFLSAFAPEAVLEVYYDGDSAAPSRVMRGHEELSQVPARLGRYQRTHHMLGQQEFSVSASTATGWVYCTARHLEVDDDGRRRDLAMFIRYRDQYLPADDGRWLLANRKVLVDWTETVPVG